MRDRWIHRMAILLQTPIRGCLLAINHTPERRTAEVDQGEFNDKCMTVLAKL